MWSELLLTDVWHYLWLQSEANHFHLLLRLFLDPECSFFDFSRFLSDSRSLFSDESLEDSEPDSEELEELEEELESVPDLLSDWLFFESLSEELLSESESLLSESELLELLCSAIFCLKRINGLEEEMFEQQKHTITAFSFVLRVVSVFFSSAEFVTVCGHTFVCQCTDKSSDPSEDISGSGQSPNRGLLDETEVNSVDINHYTYSGFLFIVTNLFQLFTSVNYFLAIKPWNRI